MGLGTVDPQQVNVSIGGNIITGFADGTFLNVERDEDTWNKVVGADGSVARSKSANKAATLTLTLLQTSPSNDILSALAALDEETGDAEIPIIIKDNSGTTLVSAPESWIQKPPAIVYGKEVQNREWVFALSKTTFFAGGNE
jgi:hypothetical protein